MSPATWEGICEVVKNEMATRVWPVVTPISLSADLNRGWAHGTGSYLSLRGEPYLLTNEHVVAEAVGFHLAHLPGPTNDYCLCNTTILTDAWPIDVALTRLPKAPGGLGREVLPASIFDRSFAPVEGELLFWLGFPGSKASRHEPITEANIHYSWFGKPLEVSGVPMLTQLFPATPVLLGFDPEKHVVLHYPSFAQSSAGGPLIDVPNPKGMSGSLLWDTKFVARTTAGNEWTSSDAKVCGLVWAAHSKPEVVVATKIEFILPALVQFLREECAYFHWIDRGRPLGDALIDWRCAEDEIPNLCD